MHESADKRGAKRSGSAPSVLLRYCFRTDSQRRKEIAILRAMGARAGSIAAIFLCEGAALGVGGTIVGVGLGFVTSFVIGKYDHVREGVRTFDLRMLGAFALFVAFGIFCSWFGHFTPRQMATFWPIISRPCRAEVRLGSRIG